MWLVWVWDFGFVFESGGNDSNPIYTAAPFMMSAANECWNVVGILSSSIHKIYFFNWNNVGCIRTIKYMTLVLFCWGFVKKEEKKRHKFWLYENNNLFLFQVVSEKYICFFFAVLCLFLLPFFCYPSLVFPRLA